MKYEKNLSAIYEPVRIDLVQVENELSRKIRSNDTFVDQVGSWVMGGKAKRVRPVLVLLSARAAGSRGGEPVRLATVVELLHTATLIHDDVIDRADVRRNRASVNSRWGNEISILYGDYLHSIALGILSDIGRTEMIARLYVVIKQMCEGEIRQYRMIFNPDLSEKEYLSIIGQKTAVLCQYSCESGAVLAGGSPEETASLSEYGRCFGMAYQIIDDCLDLVGDEPTTGKSLGSDLREGKVTLPFVHFLHSVGKDRQAEAVGIWKTSGSDSRLRKMIVDNGSVDYAIGKAQSYLVRGKEALAVLSDSVFKKSLTGLADYCQSRV